MSQTNGNSAFSVLRNARKREIRVEDDEIYGKKLKFDEEEEETFERKGGLHWHNPKPLVLRKNGNSSDEEEDYEPKVVRMKQGGVNHDSPRTCTNHTRFAIRKGLNLLEKAKNSLNNPTSASLSKPTMVENKDNNMKNNPIGSVSSSFLFSQKSVPIRRLKSEDPPKKQIREVFYSRIAQNQSETSSKPEPHQNPLDPDNNDK